MTDLISRQAAAKAVDWDSEAYLAILNLPTIDPVKHGMLIASEETNSGGLIRMVCSECNRVVYATYGVRLGEIRFCPYCGVKFDGGEDEAN